MQYIHSFIPSALSPLFMAGMVLGAGGWGVNNDKTKASALKNPTV